MKAKFNLFWIYGKLNSSIARKKRFGKQVQIMINRREVELGIEKPFWVTVDSSWWNHFEES